MKSMLLKCEIPSSNLSVWIEDDGRVAYAYLREDKKIVADVWLYNVADTPEQIDWRDRSQMPFLNPRKYCADKTLARITSQSEVRCSLDEDHVNVFLDGQLAARLVPGVCPGWSIGAAKESPLAKPLEKS